MNYCSPTCNEILLRGMIHLRPYYCASESPSVSWGMNRGKQQVGKKGRLGGEFKLVALLVETMRGEERGQG